MSSLIPLFIISFPVVYEVQERTSLCFTEEGMFSFIFLSILRCPFVSEILLECNSDFRFHHSTEHLPIKPNCLFCLKKKSIKINKYLPDLIKLFISLYFPLQLKNTVFLSLFISKVYFINNVFNYLFFRIHFMY